MEDEDLDEILGITRCARCGNRLESDLECRFCSLFPDKPKKDSISKWVYITACFLTSPLSLYFILKTDRLNKPEKVLALSGCLVWLTLYRLWF